MGYARPKPERLPEKLRQIRFTLGLSQGGLVKRLGVEGRVDGSRISKYENGKNEPPLMVLLQYARLANVYMEALVDDSLDLPEKVPSPTKSEGVRLKYPAIGKRR